MIGELNPLTEWVIKSNKHPTLSQDHKTRNVQKSRYK